MKHTLPSTLPGSWLASCKTPSSEGCYETFVVVRPTAEGSFDKFQVHNAYYKDEDETGWCYAQGTYVKTLHEALSSFARRAKLDVLNPA